MVLDGHELLEVHALEHLREQVRVMNCVLRSPLLRELVLEHIRERRARPAARARCSSASRAALPPRPPPRSAHRPRGCDAKRLAIAAL